MVHPDMNTLYSELERLREALTQYQSTLEHSLDIRRKESSKNFTVLCQDTSRRNNHNNTMSLDETTNSEYKKTAREVLINGNASR